MGARSEIHSVTQPWPVVYDAFLHSLPTKGFRVTAVEPERGHIRFESRNTRFVLAVGAVDGITSEWVATAELKIGVFRDRHQHHFDRIDDALARYLSAYYRV